MRSSMLLCWLLLCAACSGDTPAAPISDEQFVDAVVALRQAAQAAGDDPAAFNAARDEILAARNLTADQLERYVEVHATDLDHLAAVWNEINESLADGNVPR